MTANKQIVQAQWVGRCLTVLLIALSISSNSVRCQFLQPQSHLGRLVQSITSPLVLASSSGGADSPDPSSSSSSLYDSESGGGPGSGQSEADPSYQQQQKQQRGYYRQEAATGSDGPQHFQQYRAQASAGLQQAPSQQRGVPQQYYGGDGGDGGDGGHDDEDSGAPTNNRHHKQQAADGSGEQYQMGAYLGPTMDDKEIQGAFNSNDDRDDDEAAGYEGPPIEGARGGGGSRGGANAFAASQQDAAAGYAPQADAAYSGWRGQMTGGGQPGERANFDDELGADEDDEPAPRARQPRFRSSSSMNQAASQYHHQRNQPSYPREASNKRQQQQQQSSSMMAAANGYSPMGAAGPFDSSGLVGVANGAQGYEVYNGDGSYPGPGYYQQQGNQGQGQGRRNQAASMNSPYGYGQYGPMGSYGQAQQQGQQGGRNADQDDADNDQDED